MTVLKAVERPHTAISPSSFERVASCTMSHRLAVGKLGRPVASDDAALGTAAHTLLEWCLTTGGDPEAVERIAVEGRSYRVDVRMRATVAVALDWVRERLAGRDVLVEYPISLPWGRVGGWLDVATADEPFIVADLKSGWGLVSADSAQLGLYLLGLILERRRSIEGPGAATAVIIQPRAAAAPVREHTWSFEALRALRDRLIETLDRIRKGDLSYAEGRWCRWCPAAGVCPRLAAVARDAVAVDLGVAPELVAAGEFGAAQLEAGLELAPALEHRIRSIHETAKDYLLAGGKLAGWKLAAKRDGGLTAVPRADPRPEVQVAATLRAALRASLAHETRKQVNTNARPRGRARVQRREGAASLRWSPPQPRRKALCPRERIVVAVEDRRKTKVSLPARSLASLKQALATSSAALGLSIGSGRNFLRIDDRTGAATVGTSRDPFPMRARYAVRVGSFAHGFVEFGLEGSTRETVVSMLEQPICPTPAGGYTQAFGEPGAKPVIRIVLSSLDEPGFEVTFDALGKSSANRVKNLLGDVITHYDGPDGAAGYVHPTIRVKVSAYLHQSLGREISHFDYEICGWIDDNGQMPPQQGAAPIDAPWSAEVEPA